MLDQFEEGEYQGTRWISEIYMSQYIAYGKAVTELRARLHDLQIDTEDRNARSPQEPSEMDPLDEAPAPTSTVWIRYGTGPWPGMSVTKLPIATRLGLVGAPSLLARHGPLRRPQDVLGKPLLAYTGRQHDLWQDYFQQFHLPMAALDKASRYQQLLTLTEAAISGLGYALVPQFLIEPELGAGKLQAALPQTFEFGRQHVLLHRRDAAQDQKVQPFKRWLVAQARAAQAA